jgi:hypothetical protein
VAWLVNPNRIAVPVERGRAFVQPSGKIAATLYDAMINLRHTQMLSMAGGPRPRCRWQEKIMDAEPDALAQFRENYVENMETMFAAVSDLYARYWHDFFHFAIFEGDESWDQAIEQTHRRYLRDLRIDGARSALDLPAAGAGLRMKWPGARPARCWVSTSPGRNCAMPVATGGATCASPIMT